MWGRGARKEHLWIPEKNLFGPTGTLWFIQSVYLQLLLVADQME
jgi:hypothetical protein